MENQELVTDSSYFGKPYLVITKLTSARNRAKANLTPIRANTDTSALSSGYQKVFSLIMLLDTLKSALSGDITTGTMWTGFSLVSFSIPSMS